MCGRQLLTPGSSRADPGSRSPPTAWTSGTPAVHSAQMKMKPPVRKLALTAHVTSSVGWLGAVLGYIALAVTGIVSGDAAKVSGALVSMESIGWLVLVPCSVATL